MPKICPFISAPYSRYLKSTTNTPGMTYEYAADVHYATCITVNCELWNASKGKCGMINDSNTKQSDSAILINEYMSNQDQDRKNIPGIGTAAIYGKDFIIEEDENIPPMLKNIHKNPDFVYPQIVIKWQDYLKL